MSRVFHRQPRDPLPCAVDGAGVQIVDSDGKRYLDASGGAAVSCLGHSHPAVIESIKEQLDRLAFAHSAFFTNEPMERLAEVLIADAPKGLDRVVGVSRASNARSRGAIEKLGFRLVRRWRKADGVELMFYAMSREEWLARAK